MEWNGIRNVLFTAKPIVAIEQDNRKTYFIHFKYTKNNKE